MLTEQEALNQTVELLGDIRASLRGDYDDTEGDNEIEVSGEFAESPVAEANSLRVKAVLTNLGNAVVEVYEEGSLVGLIGFAQTWVSDLDGAGEITAKCLSEDATSTVAFTGYIRNSTED